MAGFPRSIPLSAHTDKLRKFLFGFRTKVAAIAVAALLFVTLLSNFFIYRISADAQFKQLQKQLLIIAQAAALQVDAAVLGQIPLTREGTHTASYESVAAQLKQFRALGPSIKYIYILKQTDKPDTWQFVVDRDPELERQGKKPLTAYPGDKYFVGRFPEMLRALNGPSADDSLEADEWGITLSGYAPIRDASGAAAAVIGVDMDARDVYLANEKERKATLWVFLAGILVSAALAVILSDRMTARIRTLIDGTRRLSKGDLEYRIVVKGHDEISELTTSFNDMAANIQESRKKLADYFFRMVQSLVRMLEAKDKYTQGHSERVGVYAQHTALKMGFSKAEADLLRTAGELHDIGKLAVHESILTKEGQLTAEEWELIRQHPVIGAESLKPVCFDEIIMASIYSHHERHDGTGYPKKLKGDQISVFAQIIAVADAYDAMTTTRPYRKAMERSFAIEEIRRNAGTQFNPGVAEAFIRFLEEERPGGV